MVGMLPRMVKVRQVLPEASLSDVEGEIRRALRAKGLGERVKRGMRVAVTAGSRGISRIPLVLRTVVDELRLAGAEPFVLAAMGSHGGATPEGQLEVLRSLGVTEDSVGAPVVAGLEVERVGEVCGAPIYASRLALEADGVFVVGRVKPHTDFKGEVESGLLKMLAIVLGNQKGAEMIHWHRYEGYHNIMPRAGLLLAQKLNVVMGLALLEDAHHNLSQVHALLPEEFLEAEKALLEKAKEMLPRLPFSEIDVLVVDEIGKNISGVGMDTNVTGRFWMPGESDPRAPNIKRIVVLDLTEETHGNAIGIGLADLTTRRVFEKIDFQKTYVNCLTQGSSETGRIPPFLPCDRDAIATAIRICGPVEPGKARVVRIKNTLELETMYVSEALLGEALDKGLEERLEVLGEPREMVFDVLGNLAR